MKDIIQIELPGQKKSLEEEIPHNGNGSSKATNEEIEDINKKSERIQALIEEFDSLPDPKIKEKLNECMQEILSFYGYGISRIFKIISESSSAEVKEINNVLVHDEFIKGLLLIHDLHPVNIEERLNQALEKVKPYMDSHGGSVEIVSLKDNKAKLKLLGSCDGCPSSAITLELAIKEAIEENCPDLLELEVEGVASAPKNGNGKSDSVTGWKPIEGINNLANGEMKSIESSGIPLIFFSLNDQLYAYRDICPACGTKLSAGKMEGTEISCRLGHRFEIQKAGKCTSDPEIHLNPFPLLREKGVVKIAIAS